MAIIDKDTQVRPSFDDEVAATQQYFDDPRFSRITRLYTARQVAEQRGTIPTDYTVARNAAAAFYERLRELFAQKKSITTFGPYSPGQAVAMKRMGIEGIYLGGWATSAKGSTTEDPGPDLASYPLSQVPDDAAVLVRALLTADRNQQYQRLQMSEKQRAAAPVYDYRPFIIADADTGHGGDPHVRNLIRRFVEVGVPGYHIEDQRPGTKKCGHQGGKVLVPSDEQIKRLNTARFQLDIMKVPGIIVARTDAEAANLLDSRADERDQPFLLGATNLKIPSYKSCFLALVRRFYELGVKDLNGHLLYALPEGEYAEATAWLERQGIQGLVSDAVNAWREDDQQSIDDLFDQVESRFVAAWEDDAGLMTYGEAVADVLAFAASEGEPADMSAEEWREFAATASLYSARAKAKELGVDPGWDCELSKTPEGYYQIRGGIPYAIAKSLAAAPFADLLWMETKTADLDDARQFADAIHAKFPDQMLAYNLSPSFNWDTTGMTDEQMKQFPEELGKMGFVFNFITYGGHQIDGVAAEEFATSLQQDGMLALARLQRKMRLVESPYRTPQTLVGGPRSDAALTASSGRTATTKSMGEGSTQHQHLVQTEVPKKLLEEWLAMWSENYDLGEKLRVQLRPRRAGSDVLELGIYGNDDEQLANVVVDPIKDRHGRSILQVRDQNTFAEKLRQKRLMTLIHLWLVHRFKADGVIYVTPTEDNLYQTSKMKSHGIFSEVYQEVGEIIVAEVNQPRIAELLKPDRVALRKLITKEG
ncbi:isocitrate lyase ICL2 [Mycobacterium intracellulare]|uniref:isocitrate lyase n=1 Tax=Mycobacterium intracellulare subsp. chimaera TaxID=222805 RepID=A0A7U5MKN7_MYCIT|nr:isocitrate lyase ICL2 [Mycobacterium intracellulare]ASL15314.1 isocitrate lyase [Mycobacterium intracellulare subsp. chimaera]ASQ86518.1 isocitrate lyase [Mycobacterium intracellulare subsp. chimaera]MCF1815743.1 isocitrate lyase ICL2 [Mycobacterium intracellulare subsp. intracellulare]MDM3930371.1 isocitrate lyase ICL2 [Mycobacterium intracellulare subsp. chimaera]MDS0337673.1 isocitrate lyase ICL2 [Mycobacterium intracellulare]